jgi:hypothetical protein
VTIGVDVDDPGGYRTEELAQWLDLELVLQLRLGSDRWYRDAIAELAMFVLIDSLQHPEHRALPRDKDDPGGLYGLLPAAAPGVFGQHVTRRMWQTATEAAAAVLAHLAAED